MAFARASGAPKVARVRHRALVLSLILTAACGDAADAPPAAEPPVPEEARYGGTAVVAGETAISTFNPAVTADDLSAELQRQTILLTLLRTGAAGEPLPHLAESWEINDDSTRVTFRLRRDVRWHDGQPTTAADVAFTFDAIKDPEVGFPNVQWFEGWEGPEIVDRYTIRFAVRPRSDLLAGWTRLPIMPGHVMEDVAPRDFAGHPFGAEPVGNGPFRFAGRDAGGNWMFEANDEFPEALGGRPYLDRLVYRQIPEAATLFAELRSGRVHLVRRLDPGQIERVRAAEGVSIMEIPSRAYGFIAWNGKRPLFQDPEIRRALTMGIDRNAIVAAVRYGLGRVANGPIGPWHPAFDPAVAAVPFAPDSAAAKLERLGWTDADGDGLRERDGEALRFGMISTDTYEAIQTIVQAQLRRIGVDVDARTVEPGTFIDAITSPERRFDAFVIEWQADPEVDDRQLFSCDAVGQAYQFASYCNLELEPILQAIPDARSTPDQIRLLREYAAIVNRELPFTFLYFATDAVAVADGLRGVAFDLHGESTPAGEWWLHPDARPGSPASR